MALQLRLRFPLAFFKKECQTGSNIRCDFVAAIAGDCDGFSLRSFQEASQEVNLGVIGLGRLLAAPPGNRSGAFACSGRYLR